MPYSEITDVAIVQNTFHPVVLDNEITTRINNELILGNIVTVGTDGLITTKPVVRSIALTLPHVKMTNPCFTRSRLA